jgi:hypothetical protein
MNNQELRTHFDLKKCPNKPHNFEIGKLFGNWVWAEDNWSTLVGDKLNTHYFSLHKIKSVDNIVAYSIVILKLKIIWTFIK